MANIWKVGSRWSDYGAKRTCIISVFRRNNVVFVGNDDSFLSVKAGDYLAIADGYTIVSIAKAVKDAEKLKEMTIKWSIKEDERKLLNDFLEYAIGVKVQIFDLKSDDNSDRLYYQKMKSFCQIKQKELREQIIKIIKSQGKQFSVESYTCTLLPKKEKAVLDSKTKYIIPVYQRPYCWNEGQLKSFINDIFKGFWGNNKDINNQEPMFIGTMQLSVKKYIDKNEYEQLIIDGQQRLSTFWILLKLISILYTDNKRIYDILKMIHFETHVTEEQQNYLTQLLNLTEIVDNRNEQNPYLNNALIIRNIFIQNIDNSDNFSIDNFIDYLTTQVYFVVIETYAGLSKTIQIFNAINTTGLDLNGGDIFKIRMYEYLTSEKYEENAFEKVAKVYNLIDEKNKNYCSPVTNIREILEIYQDYLIARFELPVVLFDFAVDTFYERLFDALLYINQWEHFKNIKEKKVELKLEELTDIINMRYEYKWENIEEISPESMYALNSISRRSRYWRYWNVIYLLLFVQRNMSEIERIDNCQKLLISLNKLFFIYSIGYDKAINDIHTVIKNLKKRIVSAPFDYLSIIETRLNSKNKSWTNDILNKNIAYNAKKKNHICLLSAYLDEIQYGISMKDLKRKLFETWFDIEHIRANADDTIQVDEDDLQNGIGNLVMLEAEINRSIQDKSFEDKRKEYKKSIYSSIQDIRIKEKWTIDEIIKRKNKEITKILNYLYN